MDPGNIIPDVLNFASEACWQGAQLSGQVIQDVGSGTAFIIHDAADQSGAAIRTLTETGLGITGVAVDHARRAGRDVGIEPISNVVTDIIEGCGWITAGAVNMVGGVPIGAAKGAATITSLVTNISGGCVQTIGGGISGGLLLAARPEEITRWTAGVWERWIQDVREWAWNVPYNMAAEKMKKFSLLDALLLGTIMVILLLVSTWLVVVLSTVIGIVEGCRYLYRLHAIISGFTSQHRQVG